MTKKQNTSKVLTILCLAYSVFCSAQNDSIRVMVYNTLTFGGTCQTSNTPSMYPYLKNIVQFANPDIIGLDKVECTKTSTSDFNGVLSSYFPDTVISECLDGSTPGKFAFCPFTDLSNCSGGNSSLLFYNQNKLGYVSTTPMYWGVEDFDMFKLYYKQWFGGATDTTFLYVILGHTISGSSSTGRDGQDSTVMNKVRTMFTHTPNLIYMGDFNTRGSTEPGYAYITQTADTNYIMNDPPFRPDAKLSYPNTWSNGSAAQDYFTTTTRVSTIPNSCGTTGGAKDWYDHILLSPSITEGVDNLTYVPKSYTTLGNNGNRYGISVNDSTTNGKNASVPSKVANALFYFSDKYPVEVTLAVNPVLSINNIAAQAENIKINNPIANDQLVIHFPSVFLGKNVGVEILDVCGKTLAQYNLSVNSLTIIKSVLLTPSLYIIRFSTGGYVSTLKLIKQ